MLVSYYKPRFRSALLYYQPCWVKVYSSYQWWNVATYVYFVTVLKYISTVYMLYLNMHALHFSAIMYTIYGAVDLTVTCFLSFAANLMDETTACHFNTMFLLNKNILKLKRESTFEQMFSSVSFLNIKLT